MAARARRFGRVKVVFSTSKKWEFESRKCESERKRLVGSEMCPEGAAVVLWIQGESE